MNDSNETTFNWLRRVRAAQNFTGYARGDFTLIRENDNVRISKLQSGRDGVIVATVGEIDAFIEANS